MKFWKKSCKKKSSRIPRLILCPRVSRTKHPPRPRLACPLLPVTPLARAVAASYSGKT
ncbi:MAG: hypothetical protein ACLFQV_12780 [Vulcanimicrobiota bacterium]